MSLPTLPGAERDAMKNTAGKARTVPISDFLELGANAFVSGLLVAIALAVITLALASGAQAGALDDASTALTTGSKPQEPGSSAPAHGDMPIRAGALWANATYLTE